MRLYIILILVFVTPLIYGQPAFPTDPDKSEFIYDDIDKFWIAFDKLGETPDSNPFETYIKNGSQGLKDFIPHRIISADSLFRKVKRTREKYASIRENSYRLRENEKQIRSAYDAFKILYPKAAYPPTYFVIGRFNSGGTSSSAGLIIGVEMQEKIENIPLIVAHELIHFQQRPSKRSRTLLEMSIVEGSADFLSELISGGFVNKPIHGYAEVNSNKLIVEFVSIMNEYEYKDWLYSTSRKDDRPRDLGYWIGYKITKAYYDKAIDKQKAIDNIINIRDYSKFADESGFLKTFLEKTN